MEAFDANLLIVGSGFRPMYYLYMIQNTCTRDKLPSAELTNDAFRFAILRVNE